MVVGSGVGTTKFKWVAGCLKRETLTLYYRDLGLTAFLLFTDYRYCKNDAFMKKSCYWKKFWKKFWQFQLVLVLTTGLKITMIIDKAGKGGSFSA